MLKQLRIFKKNVFIAFLLFECILFEMNAFYDTCCHCDNVNDKSEHILEVHVKDILSNIIQPVFKRHITQHPALTRRPVTKYKAESELHEEQDWKKDQYVYILRWIIEEAEVIRKEKKKKKINFYSPQRLKTIYIYFSHLY